MNSLICAATIFINLTNDPWNLKDEKILKRAQVVCSTDYRHKGFPCVKQLTKCPDQHYDVICGAKK